MYKINYYEENKKGNDYAVGDIHGEYLQLEEKLKEIGFNPKCDRLFATGDLVNRGRYSHMVIDWLKKPWFIPVRGNHDHCIASIRKGGKGMETKLKNVYKGEWYFEQSKSFQESLCKRFELLPVANCIKTEKGPVVIVHADLPTATWKTFENQVKMFNLKLINEAISSFERHKIKNQIIPDVRAVICGHTSGKNVRILGNFYIIDTGCGMEKGRLTILSLKTLEEV